MTSCMAEKAISGSAKVTSSAMTMSPISRDILGISRGSPILGKPSAEQQRGYQLTLDVHRKTIELCRPGVTAGEIYAFVVRGFKKAGIEYTASLVGHGMGPWFHQQEPVLRRNSEIVIEEGMIIAIEPQRLHWHLQDLIVIEDGKPRLLSDRFPTDQVLVIE